MTNEPIDPVPADVASGSLPSTDTTSSSKPSIGRGSTGGGSAPEIKPQRLVICWVADETYKRLENEACQRWEVDSTFRISISRHFDVIPQTARGVSTITAAHAAELLDAWAEDN